MNMNYTNDKLQQTLALCKKNALPYFTVMWKHPCFTSYLT